MVASLAPEGDWDSESHPRSWLQIIDITNPAQPRPLGECPISEDARALQVVGRYAYLAGGSWSEDTSGWRDGLMVVEVSDPAHPTPVVWLSTPGWAAGLQVVGDHVYLADGPAGLAIVSLPMTALMIIEEPQSYSVLYGKPGTLIVVAYSVAPINYQWYQGQSGDTSHPVAGATNASCSTPALTQSGSYWVRVSSGTNSFDTSSATLAVVPLVLWGDTSHGQINVPPGLTNPVAIAAGNAHSLALTAEGRVVPWGSHAYGQTTVPSGLSNVVAIAAGDYHSLALTANGCVVGWGNNTYGQTNVPSGLSDVAGIAAGASHSLALTAEGRVVAWGANWDGQTNVPSGLSNVVAIAAGDYHSLALTADGRVVAWGGQRERDDRAQRVEPRGGHCGGIGVQSGADGRGPSGRVGQ